MDDPRMTDDLPSDLADQVDAWAVRLRQPRQWIIEQALTAWLSRTAREYELTLEGLADVDHGRVVPHADVEAWAESLGTDNPRPLPRPA